jgi:hypothetical protein
MLAPARVAWPVQLDQDGDLLAEPLVAADISASTRRVRCDYLCIAASKPLAFDAEARQRLQSQHLDFCESETVSE